MGADDCVSIRWQDPESELDTSDTHNKFRTWWIKTKLLHHTQNSISLAILARNIEIQIENKSSVFWAVPVAYSKCFNDHEFRIINYSVSSGVDCVSANSLCWLVSQLVNLINTQRLDKSQHCHSCHTAHTPRHGFPNQLMWILNFSFATRWITSLILMILPVPCLVWSSLSVAPQPPRRPLWNHGLLESCYNAIILQHCYCILYFLCKQVLLNPLQNGN